MPCWVVLGCVVLCCVVLCCVVLCCVVLCCVVCMCCAYANLAHNMNRLLSYLLVKPPTNTNIEIMKLWLPSRYDSALYDLSISWCGACA